MSVLVGRDTRVLVQGVSGRLGAYHTERMLEYGTRVVAGVTPGRGGADVHGVPVFDTVKEAVEASGATASVVMVPPPFAADAIMEAADGGIGLTVAITDGIPARDMIRVKRYMRRYRAERRMRLLGPNTAGVIVPERTLLGVVPTEIHRPGRVGLVTRSSTLGYEAAVQLGALELGVSTAVGIGGGPIGGSAFVDMLPLFEADPDTDLILLIDESGSAYEPEIVDWIVGRGGLPKGEGERRRASAGERSAGSADGDRGADGRGDGDRVDSRADAPLERKPVVALMGSHGLGQGALAGHVGVLMSAFGERTSDMRSLLGAAGVTLVPHPAAIGETVAEALAGAG